MSSTSPEWSSPFTNWYNRTTPLPSSTPISKSNLLFVVTYSAMGGKGLELAVFKPNVAITPTGQILKLQAGDFIGFSRLAENSLMLPAPEDNGPRGAFEDRAFRIAHQVTCLPFTILEILKDNEHGEPVLDKTSVYGFSKSIRELEYGGELPDVLWELLGLVSEVPTEQEAERDKKVLERIARIRAEFAS